MNPDPERTFLHDLSSPLTALQISLGALEEDLTALANVPADALEQVQLLRRIAERMTRMVQTRREQLRAAGGGTDLPK